MNILISGATGLIGQKLSLRLIEQGHKLFVVSTRDKAKFLQSFTLPCTHIQWKDLQNTQLDQKIDAVFHLAGDNVASSLWTQKKKNKIIESRISTNHSLVSFFKKHKYWPKTYISASAVGYYGNQDDRICTEDSSYGEGFLSDVCQSWEKSSIDFTNNCRSVHVRIPLVLDDQGGFLQKVEPIFSFGLGGKLGKGKQYISWIHIQDLLHIFEKSLNDSTFSGPLNACSPYPLQNKAFTKALANQLQRWAPFPVPSFLLRAFLGEMSSIALDSTRAISTKLENSDFQFPRLEQALNHLYSWKTHPNLQRFASQQFIPKKTKDVFLFFSETKNLEKITPPSLKFKILNQSSPNVQKGTLIDYTLKIHGIPCKWKTLIQDWQKNKHFIDTQLRGPYSFWHHTHNFKDMQSGTLMSDNVIYRLPMGTIGRITSGLLVRKDIQKIFNFRSKICSETFK